MIAAMTRADVMVTTGSARERATVLRENLASEARKHPFLIAAVALIAAATDVVVGFGIG